MEPCCNPIQSEKLWFVRNCQGYEHMEVCCLFYLVEIYKNTISYSSLNIFNAIVLKENFYQFWTCKSKHLLHFVVPCLYWEETDTHFLLVLSNTTDEFHSC